MADEITDGIDRAFGALDRAFDIVESIFGRTRQVDKKATKVRATVQRARATKSGVVARAPFRIDEVIDAETSEPVWIVTNGTSKVECSSAELAESMKKTLEGEL